MSHNYSRAALQRHVRSGVGYPTGVAGAAPEREGRDGDLPDDGWVPPVEIPPAPEQSPLPEDDGLTGGPRFVPVAIDNVQIADEPAWLIERLLPARGLACIVGPPKSGKSYFTTDLMLSVARGALYAGRTTLDGPVVYLTGEGVQGFKRRLIGMRQHHGIEGRGVPFFMIDNVPDLGSEKTDLAVLLRDLDAYLMHNNISQPRAIVLDTLARCMGDGDENATRDMGRFVNRCGLIERHFGCVVVVVHHTGKDKSKGSRGSNSLNGAADVTMIVTKGDDSSSVRVDEMKDGPEGDEWKFRLVPFPLKAQQNEPRATSDATTTCIVELLSQPAASQQRATTAEKPIRGVNGDLLKVIRRAVQEVGELNVGSVQVPNNVRAVSRPNLRNYCTTMDWQQPPGTKEASFRGVLSRGLSTLRERSLIGFDVDWVWLT